VGQLRLWADGLDVNEGRLDKALEQSTVVKTALFTVFISMTTLLTKGSISQSQTASDLELIGLGLQRAGISSTTRNRLLVFKV
jgi:hypothetical protein